MSRAFAEVCGYSIFMTSSIPDRAAALDTSTEADPSPRANDARRVSRTARLGLPLSAEPLALARTLVADEGLTDAARLLGTSRNTLAAAAGGAGLREGTRVLLEQRLRGLQTASTRRGAR